MTENGHGQRVAAVGSPSSNYEVTIDLANEARELPLVGAVLALENKMGEGSELAIGTISEIVTTNKWHEDPAFRGVLRTSGEIMGMSGDEGDVRQATVRLQAAWRRPDAASQWHPSGPSLRMSPATGTAVRTITDSLISDLTAATEDLHYMGHLAGTDDIKLPLSVPEFSGGQGAWHGAVFGLSGAGKSAATCYLLASQFRRTEQAFVIVDPQGQWSSGQELPFDLGGFAAELGRDVLIHRISEDLRLAKDAPLFTSLLQHTKLVVELGLKSEATTDIVWYEITKALRERTDWTSDTSEDLLRALLSYLADPTTASRVYTTPDNATRFQARVTDLLASPAQFADALHQFAPIHNLFQTTNASGQPRHDLGWTLKKVFSRPAGQPAPLLILDMSTRAIPGMDEEIDEALDRALQILDSDQVKAAILRNLFHTLKRESEKEFRDGRNLNTMIVLDEAWRYAAPPASIDEEEIATLSKELAGYARDTRKFGIGWLYITQSTRSLNQDIWAQLSVRLFGYGLNGGDLDKVGEVVDDRAILRLYRTFANPRQSGRYPFMVTGPVSPLAANATPVLMHVYTDFDHFRLDNAHWIKPIRDALGQPVVYGNPAKPNPRTAARGRKAPAVQDLRSAIITTNKEVRENRAAIGVKDPNGFGTLANIDDDDAPPF